MKRAQRLVITGLVLSLLACSSSEQGDATSNQAAGHGGASAGAAGASGGGAGGNGQAGKGGAAGGSAGASGQAGEAGTAGASGGAAGSSGGAAGTSGAAGVAGTGNAGAGGEAGAGGNSDACKFHLADADCNKCMNQECLTECTSLVAAADYASFISCRNSCSDDQCVARCKAQNPKAGSQADRLDGCLMLKCTVECN